MEQELDDFIEWLRVLKLPEADFRKHIRPYFSDTVEMNQYIERRAPQQEARYSQDSGYRTPTMPAPVIETPKTTGHYKGKRRKR